ncbi:hypothetical protein [Thalassolituus maritimus]
MLMRMALRMTAIFTWLIFVVLTVNETMLMITGLRVIRMMVT